MAWRLQKACTGHAFRRIAAWSTCAATVSIGIVNFSRNDTLKNRFQVCSAAFAAVPLLSRPALCDSNLQDPGYVHFENERLCVTEVKLQPGESVETGYDFPHLRWEVLPPGSAQTPMPTFHSGGQSHILQAKAGTSYREYVFEFLGPPKYSDLQFKQKQAAAWYQGSPGTKFMFENEYCVAFDFRVPPYGGDEHDMHQHTVDHFFVILDLPGILEVYVPGTTADLPAADRKVHNVKFAGKLNCTDVATSWRYSGEVGDGGFVDGKPKFGAAVHGVCNPLPREFREYYVDLK